MYRQFLQEMPETDDKDKSWAWIGKSDLKVETEAPIFSAQEQALRTNYVKYNINKSVDSPLCRLCNQKRETINHILSECKMLAQKEYKRRHDNIARLVHWKLCCKYDVRRSEKWYKHQPGGVVEDERKRKKIEKYQDLKGEIGILLGIKHLEVVPVVVGTLGAVSKRLDAWLEKIGFTIRTGMLH